MARTGAGSSCSTAAEGRKSARDVRPAGMGLVVVMSRGSLPAELLEDLPDHRVGIFNRLVETIHRGRVQLLKALSEREHGPIGGAFGEVGLEHWDSSDRQSVTDYPLVTSRKAGLRPSVQNPVRLRPDGRCLILDKRNGTPGLRCIHGG